MQKAEQMRTPKREQIIKLLATLTVFFSVVGLLGFAIVSGSSAEAETEAARATEPTPEASSEPSVIAEQSKPIKDISIQTAQAIDEIDPGGKQQTQVDDSAPVVVADRESVIGDIDPDALQRLKAAEWLLKKNSQHYLIQLKSGTDYQKLNKDAYAVAQALAVDPSKGIVVFPYRSNKEGKTVYGFGIGPYRNATAARNDINELPQDVKQHGTWIRKLDELQVAVAEIRSGESGNSPSPELVRAQLEQASLANMPTVVVNPQSDDVQQQNNVESILLTDKATQDVAIWVESGVEETVFLESALQGVATEQTLPTFDEQPILEFSRDVTPKINLPQIENNQQGVVLEFQPLEFQELEFEQ